MEKIKSIVAQFRKIKQVLYVYTTESSTIAWSYTNIERKIAVVSADLCLKTVENGIQSF